MFVSACSTWTTKSSLSNRCRPFQPTWPAMNTSRPSATMPLAKPLALAQSRGCSACMKTSLIACSSLLWARAPGPARPIRCGRALPRAGSPARRRARSWSFQLEALHLAGLGLGQGRGELDGAGVLEGRDLRLDVILQALGAGGVAGNARLQHHVRLHDLAALSVGDT